jgi:hypothetical protein
MGVIRNALTGALVLLAAGCGYPSGTLISMNAPQPFSAALRDYLQSSPPVRRAEVVRWLGEPDLVRNDGRLLIYVATREISHDPLYRTADVHVLLLEMDGEGRVRGHDVIVNGGCSASGICIEGPFGPSSETSTLSVEEIRRKAVDGLVIFESGSRHEPPTPAAADDQCELFVFRARDCQEDMRVWPPGAESAQAIPAEGFLQHQVAPGPLDLRIEWTELERFLPVEFAYTGKEITVECPAGQQVFVQLSLAKTRMQRRDYSLEFKVMPADVGREAIAQRARIIN